MSTLERISADPHARGFGIIAIGLLVGIISALGMAFVRPAVVIVIVGGFVLLLPTFFLRDPRSYWLFLLVASIPFDIYKSLSRWIVAPELLIDLYGPPTAGNASFDFYLTDAVLLLIVVHWAIRLCLRQDHLYFPKVGYLFVLYLFWALIGSVTQAETTFVAMLEWCRQVLYFLAFVYLINNVKTRAQLRAIVFALFVGLGLASGSVIGFSAVGVGTDTKAFDMIFSDRNAAGAKDRPGTMYAVSGEGAGDPKRSEGMFSHPAIAAAYLGLTVPLALAFLAATQRWREGILFGGFAATGYFASYLTFSRAGLIALAIGSAVLLFVGRWCWLVSRQRFIAGVVMFAIATAASVPLLIYYLGTRPASYNGRFEYAEIALESYWQRPILGAGLNNGSSAIKEASSRLPKNGPNASQPSIPCHYLVILIESGIVGFLLFFAFFGVIIVITFRSMRTGDMETKAILTGIVGGFSAIAFQNLADNPLAGHSVSALIWLFAGLTVVVARLVQSERALPASQRLAPAIAVKS